MISMKTPNMIDAKRRNKDNVNYIEYNVDLNFGNGKTFFVRTYGCQMNEHDSEKIRGMLKTCGFEEASSYENADVVIKAAAVADFTPSSFASDKIKKEDGMNVINLTKTSDILKELGERKTKQTLVGFCMETKDLIESAKSKARDEARERA